MPQRELGMLSTTSGVTLVRGLSRDTFGFTRDGEESGVTAGETAQFCDTCHSV
jgi:hypothetical protein